MDDATKEQTMQEHIEKFMRTDPHKRLETMPSDMRESLEVMENMFEGREKDFKTGILLGILMAVTLSHIEIDDD